MLEKLQENCGRVVICERFPPLFWSKLRNDDTFFLFPSFFYQGFKIDLNCKQLTVDFVNQSVLQISSQDVESKRSDKTDFAEQLGAMNRRWQILQGLVMEKVKRKTYSCSEINCQNTCKCQIVMTRSLCRSSSPTSCSNRAHFTIR